MKLIINFLLSITIVATVTFTLCVQALAGTLISGHVLAANNDINFSAYHLPVESETIAYPDSSNSQHSETDSMDGGQSRLDAETLFTSSHSDASELVKPSADTTDYTLSVGYGANRPRDPASLGDYVDNSEAKKITLEADVLRGNSNVPEPSSIILFTLGMLGLSVIRRQKNMFRHFDK